MWRAVAVAFAVVAVVRAPCPSSRNSEAMGTRGWRMDASGEAVMRAGDGAGEEWEDEEDDADEADDADEEDDFFEDPISEAMERFWEAKRSGIL